MIGILIKVSRAINVMFSILFHHNIISYNLIIKIYNSNLFNNFIYFMIVFIMLMIHKFNFLLKFHQIIIIFQVQKKLNWLLTIRLFIKGEIKVSLK